jgi:hypothetical protein
MPTTKALSTAAPQTLAEMIELGRYDWKNPAITETNFPSIDPSRFTTKGVELLHFDRDILTKAAIAEMDKQGFRPATTEELLAYGAENPEEQRKHPLVALGSSWIGPGGYRLVPYLAEGAGRRRLNLLWAVPSRRWLAACRFLVVRKSGT